jgi:catechol 2,3-dioxygenase-like lactoylglutathione lyase family enzyme
MQSTISPIKNRVNNVFIHVKDLKKSVEWYSTILGLPVDLNEVKSPVHNIPVEGNTGLTLDDHTFDPGFTFTPSSQVLFNLYGEDIDAVYEFLKKQNVKIVREIERVGDFAYFNFEDPDQNVLMICNC